MTTKDQSYEVVFTIRVSVFVNSAEDQEDAMEQAEEEIFGHPGSVVDAKATALKTDYEIDLTRRHADEEC